MQFAAADGSDPYTVFLSSDLLGEFTGNVYVGLRQSATVSPLPYDNNYPAPAIKSSDGANIVDDYSIVSYSSSCLFFNKTTNSWSSNGCVVCFVVIILP